MAEKQLNLLEIADKFKSTIDFYKKLQQKRKLEVQFYEIWNRKYTKKGQEQAKADRESTQ
jgi:hypothetical protein